MAKKLRGSKDNSLSHLVGKTITSVVGYDYDMYGDGENVQQAFTILAKNEAGVEEMLFLCADGACSAQYATISLIETKEDFDESFLREEDDAEE